MEWYRRFLAKNGIVGVIMSAMAVVYVLNFFLTGILGEAGYNEYYANTTFPMDLETLVSRPWTILTYWLMEQPLLIWLFLVDMVLLYTYGHILNAMVGDRVTQGIIVFAILVNAILTLLISNILPTVEVTPTVALWGLSSVNCTLIAAAVTLVPNYNFQIIRSNVKLIWVGLTLLAIQFLVYRFVFAVTGIGCVVGALVGFGLIRSLQSGVDLTAWAQFSFGSKSPKSRIRVHINEGEKNDAPRSRQKRRINVVHSPSATNDEEELNRILDRINEVGYEGLTRKEKETLERLSRDD